MTGYQILAGAIAFLGVLGGVILIGRIESMRQTKGEVRFDRSPRNEFERFAIGLLNKTTRFRLDRAGIRTLNEQSIFTVFRLSLAILCAVVAGFATIINGTVGASLILFLVGFVLGWWLPGFWLDLRGKARQNQIGIELPLMFDLLVTCIKGGMSLDSAWCFIREEMAKICPPLAEEMELAEFEIGIGVPRDTALRNITQRSGVAGFSIVAGMLDQSERYGSGMAETFRAHADEVRNEQWQAMEENAHVASIKILFPMTIFLFPAMLLLIVGPMLTFLVRALENAF